MNAFADHFLEDSFATGHMRTPRRMLHGSVNLAADACVKVSISFFDFHINGKLTVA